MKRPSGVAFASGLALAGFVLNTLNNQRLKKKIAASRGSSKNDQATKRVGVNLEFYKQIKKLFPIIFPKILCRETGLLGSLALILIVTKLADDLMDLIIFN